MNPNEESSDDELRELRQKGEKALEVLKELSLKTDSKELNEKIKQGLVKIYPTLNESKKDLFNSPDRGLGLGHMPKKLFDSFTEDQKEPAMYTMKMAKLNTFKKGENFARFCDRFCECIALTKVEDENLYLYFLQHVDDTTYSLLRPIELTNDQKGDCHKFCPIYKDVIYGEESMPLKNELRNLKQEVDEDVVEYSSRLREKSSIAFEDCREDIKELECLLAFVNGLRSKYIKTKLSENNASDFNEAVKLAMRFEKIEKTMDPQEIHSIMKHKSSVSFKPKVEKHPASSTEDTRQEAAAPMQTSHHSRPRRRESPGDWDTSMDSHNRSWSKDRDRSWSCDSSGRSRSRTSDDRASNRSSSRDSRSRNGRSTSRDNSYSRSQGKKGESSTPRGYRNQNNWRSDRPRYPTRRNQSNKDKVCWGCGKNGHIRRFCYSQWPSQNQLSFQPRDARGTNWPLGDYRDGHLN